VTTTPPATNSTTAPSTTPTRTPEGSGDGLTGGGSADAKSNSSDSSGKNTIIIAVVVIAVVVLLASLYVFRRHRSRKEDSATELQRQLDDHDLELGQSAYISTKAAATDDIIVSDLGASGGPGGNSGNGSRGSYSRPSFPYQKNQQSPASWSSERTTAVSAGDRESLSGLWNDPELLAARIPYEKLHFGELLSRGGFGEVYVGEYHNRRVAIKQLIPDNRKRMAALEDFLKEAALLVPLEHERIVAFVGVAWDSPRDLCIVLEFMPNGDLRNLLAEWRQEGRMMGWADVRKVRIALHVAEALTYLHTLSPKIVHRDLKSKNILLDEQWQAKLSDFGISRTESTHNTMTTNVGSSLWIAPEVMMGNNYNEKADIFSFGIVLTELDSLQLPYYNALTPDGRKMPDAAVLHLVTMGKLQAEFSSMSRKDMMLLGRACLAMDPMQRPTAGEIRFRLSQILGTY
jgi:tRNA A-37 threonylcarbamoyl transferase component Bud32